MTRNTALALATILLAAASTTAQQDTPTPAPTPAPTPHAEPEPQADPTLPPGIDPATAERIREARRRADEARQRARSAAPPASGAAELSPEMIERLKEAGIDPNELRRPAAPGAALPMPSMPSMPGMPAAGAAGLGPVGAGAPPMTPGASMPTMPPASAPGASAPARPLPPPGAQLDSTDAAAVIDRMAGDWNLVIRLYDRGQPQPPTTGTSRFERVLDGRFLRETFSGDYGNERVEGVGYTAFDDTRGLFTMAWLDSTGGAVTTALGSYDPDRATLTFAGLYEGSTPPAETRTTITLGESDRHVYTFSLVQPNGAELTVYEIIYRRAEPPARDTPITHTPDAHNHPERDKGDLP